MLGSIVECSITAQAQKMNSATLRLFSLAKQCPTQNFSLRGFKSGFDAIKFLGHLHVWGCLHFWGRLQFWGHLHFEVVFSIYPMSRPNLLFIKILNVALLSQAKQSECATVHFLAWLVKEHSNNTPQQW